MTLGTLARVKDRIKQQELFNRISTDGVVDPAKFLAQKSDPVLIELVNGLVDLSLPFMAQGKSTHTLPSLTPPLHACSYFCAGILVGWLPHQRPLLQSLYPTYYMHTLYSC